jgi:hypothetical protein
MCVSTHLLKLCEELFEEVTPNEMATNATVAQEATDLCEFLSDQADSGGDGDDADVIAETQTRLQKIRSLISRGEKCKNPSLVTRFSELQEHLEYLLEENCPTEEDSSWKDEYLLDNEGDDFYDDSDDFYDVDSDEFDEEDAC